MSYLQNMQQFLISPLLAKKKAAAIKADPELLERASREETGAMIALKEQLQKLNDSGFARVMVAACHVSLLRVAKVYLERECPSVGDVMIYEGSLSTNKRNVMKRKFLEGERTVLLMSIEAGGTGLHLVPGSNAVVFWGSRPYSPQSVLQCKKRVHRIQQTQPVEVYHLISRGSVDYAIDCVHKDKLALANAVVDNDMTSLEAENGKWKTTGRIMDHCLFVDDDGNFTEKDIDDIRARMKARAYSDESDDIVYEDDAELPSGAPQSSVAAQLSLAAQLLAQVQAIARPALTTKQTPVEPTDI